MFYCKYRRGPIDRVLPRFIEGRRTGCPGATTTPSPLQTPAVKERERWSSAAILVPLYFSHSFACAPLGLALDKLFIALRAAKMLGHRWITQQFLQKWKVATARYARCSGQIGRSAVCYPQSCQTPFRWHLNAHARDATRGYLAASLYFDLRSSILSHGRQFGIRHHAQIPLIIGCH